MIPAGSGSPSTALAPGTSRAHQIGLAYSPQLAARLTTAIAVIHTCHAGLPGPRRRRTHREKTKVKALIYKDGDQILAGLLPNCTALSHELLPQRRVP